jgi:hypothetical protein
MDEAAIAPIMAGMTYSKRGLSVDKVSKSMRLQFEVRADAQTDINHMQLSCVLGCVIRQPERYPGFQRVNKALRDWRRPVTELRHGKDAWLA